MISNFMRAPMRRFGSSAAHGAVAKTSAPSAGGISRIGNGIRVVAEPTGQPTVSFAVSIDAGSRNDQEDFHGTAHFIEHMAFSGTSKRSQAQLWSEMDALGGQFSVSTGREQTVYKATVFSKDAHRALELLGDVIGNSTFDNAEKERAAVLEKIAEHEDKYCVIDHLHQTAFMNTSLARNVVGTAGSVARVNKDKLIDFSRSNYTGNKIVLSAAGDIDQAKLVDIAEKTLGGISASRPATATAKGPDAAIFTGSDKRMRFDSMPAANIALAFKSASHTSAYTVPLMVMQSILGSWDRTSAIGRNAGSKLAQAAAEFNLCHSFRAINYQYSDAGLFGVVITSPDNKLDDSMFYVLDSLVRLVHNLTEEELVRAKTGLKASLLAGNDSNSQVAENMGNQILQHGRTMPIYELFARIDAITVADINKTANDVINDEDHALAATGPLFELPDYNWIRRRSSWTRY